MEDLDIVVDENNYETGIRKILEIIRSNWKYSDIKFKLFTDGITNKLVGCFYSDPESDFTDVILVRIYGNNTDLIVDRNAEKTNIKLLHGHNKLAPELYATFKNGLCYEYVPGVTPNSKSIYEPKIWRLVATHMASMHKLPLTSSQASKEPMLKTKTLKFLDLIPEKFTDQTKDERVKTAFPSVARLRDEFNELYSALEKTNSPVLFCHNDLLPGNVIYTEEANKVTFIDYEYAELNHQAFDIGNHFAEFPGIGSDNIIDYTKYPSKEFQLEWLRVYLEEFNETANVTDEEVETLYKQVNKFALASHFLWTCWSLIQAEHSTIDFDFLGFGEIRYKEYLAKRDAFLSL